MNKLLFGNRLLLFLCLFHVVSGIIFAETWNFSANQVSSIQRNKVFNTVLDGDVKVYSDRMDILADHIAFSGPDYEVISGNGNIRMREKEKHLTIEARQVHYNREKKIIQLSGFVTLIDEDDKIVIRCESLVFYEDDDFVVMQVAVRLIKDDIVGRGEFASYRRKEKMLELSGRPIVWKEDDKYQADRITVDLDTDEITMEGTVQGALTTEEKEKTTDENPETPQENQ